MDGVDAVVITEKAEAADLPLERVLAVLRLYRLRPRRASAVGTAPPAAHLVEEAGVQVGDVHGRRDEVRRGPALRGQARESVEGVPIILVDAEAEGGALVISTRMCVVKFKKRPKFVGSGSCRVLASQVLVPRSDPTAVARPARRVTSGGISHASRMHEDFYSVATTAALVFLLGGMYAVNRKEAEGMQGWQHFMLYVFFAGPALGVLFISLGVLSGDISDTSAWRTTVRYLVLVQVMTGMVGFLSQSNEHRK
ncbi:hypothetical protein O2W15_02115 [Modestobacter sp. VKM Ac-2979]|uniref:hypothetical protein n=1 Tax=unclassified Modestobacter TaxID=2643866 RepID=UPI0022AB854B|nr:MULTISPECIES: hypothetical protein [unclassified Modestobacter]MCZ2810221.1 hypothetical protein [Modestobacter sp. VKM Ac-2979]MCZ2841707.1 hypothetical protein [Modestobacter sp. VKM Ac-2980]